MKAFSPFRILITCVAISLACTSFLSQGSAGRILGTITDQSGAVIPGVTVTIRDADRGTARTIVTDEAGVYNAPNLLPGTYTIRVELTGFATVERTNMRLDVGQDMRVDVSLKPGQQTELITVQAENSLVETNNAELGGTIANAVIATVFPCNPRGKFIFTPSFTFDVNGDFIGTVSENRCRTRADRHIITVAIDDQNQIQRRFKNALVDCVELGVPAG